MAISNDLSRRQIDDKKFDIISRAVHFALNRIHSKKRAEFLTESMERYLNLYYMRGKARYEISIKMSIEPTSLDRLRREAEQNLQLLIYKYGIEE